MVGDHFAVCMRVESSRPKLMKGGETGWLHPLDSNYKPPPQSKKSLPVPTLNVATMLGHWRSAFIRHTPARELGVSSLSLQLLECTPTVRHNVFAFPMKDWRGCYTGIRLRASNGAKWAEPGSHAGLFIPTSPPQKTVFIVEGPTDCAALLTLGLWGIGRPSCSGGVDFLKLWFATQGMHTRCVIIADVDHDRVHEDTGQVSNPGIRGARTLQEHVPVPSVIITLPAKDTREFLRNGGTSDMIMNQVNQSVWHQPNTTPKS